jgi:heme-degrading monooxygenase HmoA
LPERDEPRSFPFVSATALNRWGYDMVTVSYRLTVHGDTVGFEQVLQSITAYLHAQPGFLGHRVYRSQGRPEVYIAAADWVDDEAHRRAARSAGFLSRIRRMVGLARAEPEVLDLVATEAAVAR